VVGVLGRAGREGEEVTNAQIWVTIILTFLLGESAIGTWSNVTKRRQLPRPDSGRALQSGAPKDPVS